LDVIFIDTLSVLSLMFEDFKILPILDMLSDGTGRPPQNGEPIHPAAQDVFHDPSVYHDTPRGAMGLAALTGLGGAPRCFSGWIAHPHPKKPVLPPLAAIQTRIMGSGRFVVC
jgi:hypothetical protein